jgi:hypothetical protein
MCNVRGLRRERNGSRSGECGGEARKHHEVSVKRDSLKPANAERGKAVVMLQASKLPFHGPATVDPPQRVDHVRPSFLARAPWL